MEEVLWDWNLGEWLHQYLKSNAVPTTRAFFIAYLLRVAFLSTEVVIDETQFRFRFSFLNTTAYVVA